MQNSQTSKNFRFTAKYFLSNQFKNDDTKENVPQIKVITHLDNKQSLRNTMKSPKAQRPKALETPRDSEASTVVKDFKLCRLNYQRPLENNVDNVQSKLFVPVLSNTHNKKTLS